MSERKKYYWLKLKRDFFKRHDVQIIEGMENGKDYILFYLKLLVESIDHDGNLRFSETIPYDDNMLATITRTNIDTVRCAMKVFHEFELIEVLDNQTLYMNKITEMVGSETEWAEKKRIYREDQKLIETPVRHKKTLSDKSIETELELELETELDKHNVETINNQFESFWSVYPKKAGKKQALASYTKLYKASSLPDSLIAIVQKWCNTEDWKKDAGKYIPLPATWLNGERWNDELTASTSAAGNYAPRINNNGLSFKV